MTRLSRLSGLALLVALAGCPSESGSGSSSAQKPPPFANEAAILQANAADPSTAQTLELFALDRTNSVSMRYAALRRLEESKSNRAIFVAENLVTDPSRTRDADFLRKNGLRVLAEDKSPAGKGAFERVKNSSVEVSILATRLKEEK